MCTAWLKDYRLSWSFYGCDSQKHILLKPLLDLVQINEGANIAILECH
jgi:hypothetical protein